MAEAALHLLPHLFMPKHDHGDGGPHEGLGSACTLIALGFLAAFAIDRFGGVRQRQQLLLLLHLQKEAEQKETEQKAISGAGEQRDPAAGAADAAAATDATHAAAALAVLRGGGEVPAAVAVEEKKEEEEPPQQQQQQEEAATDAPELEPDHRGDYLRTSLAYSTITDDGASAAGAMIASAHIGQTPPQPRKPPVLSADLPELVEVVPQGAAATPVTPDGNGAGTPSAAAAPSSEPPAPSSSSAAKVSFAATPEELTRYGNPKGEAAAAAADAPTAGVFFCVRLSPDLTR